MTARFLPGQDFQVSTELSMNPSLHGPCLCVGTACRLPRSLVQHLGVLGIQTPNPHACVASSSTTESPPHKNNWRESNSKQYQPGVWAALTWWWSHRLQLTSQEIGHSVLAPWVPGMHIHGGEHKIIIQYTQN